MGEQKNDDKKKPMFISSDILRTMAHASAVTPVTDQQREAIAIRGD